MLKQRATGGDPTYKMSAGSYLLYSAEASSHTIHLIPPCDTDDFAQVPQQLS
jgi:solute carrier family 25 (mitochondrial folate transporter), member 32